jgi:hypothetical protein
LQEFEHRTPTIATGTQSRPSIKQEFSSTQSASTSLLPPENDVSDGCDTDDEEGDDDDSPDFNPRKKRRGEDGEIALRFTDKIWIRQLTPWADRHQVSTPALTALLGHLVEFGKGDPSNVTLSNWTVAKQHKEGRIDESLSAELEEFGNDILVHWDEVSVKLGKNQGNSDPKGKAKTKHLFVTTTCTKGEKKLGVLVVPNGKSK